MIYEQTIPPNRLVHLGPGPNTPWPQGHGLRSLFNTCTEVRQEIVPVVHRECGFRITIHPYDPLPVNTIENIRWSHTRSIEIYFDHGFPSIAWTPFTIFNDPIHYDDGDLRISKMYKKIKKVLSILPRIKTLAPLTVRFRDEPRPTTGYNFFGDHVWTRKCRRCLRQDRACTILARSHDEYLVPHLDRLLNPFIAKSRDGLRFRSVHIVPLRGVCALPSSED